MRLVIDNREHYLIDKLKGESTEIIVRTLDIGDIIIENDDGTIVLAIERKAVDDLSSSICDGRFREQKARLLGCVEKSRVMYIIEGNITKSTTVKGGCDTLLGSIINTMFRDGIKVFKTNTLDETAKVVIKLYAKAIEGIVGSNSEVGVAGVVSPLLPYTAVLKKKKKDNMTPSVMFHHTLTLIPQVSDKIAEVIVEKYVSISSLLSSYMELKDDVRKDMLKNMEYSIKDGKKRKVGPKISERIYGFVFNETENTGDEDV